MATSIDTPRKVQVAKSYDTWAWLFMRYSAVLLIPLVWIHVLINDVLVGVHAIDLSYVAQRWALWGWRTYDILLLAFTFAHGVNGLRTVTRDYLHKLSHRKVLDWGLFVLWLLISAIGAAAIIGGVKMP